MNRCFPAAVLAVGLFCTQSVFADKALMKTHCSRCHGGAKPKADFHLKTLGNAVDAKNVDFWINSLDYVKAGEMPPAKQSRLSAADRCRLVQFLEQQIRRYDSQARESRCLTPRRLNNREFVNSIADVLMIEDVGTHQPTASLLGDSLHDGFDTNGDALGLSEFHLEQYINAYRRIVDATILTGERPQTHRITVTSDDLRVSDRSNRGFERGHRRRPGIAFIPVDQSGKG